MRFKNEETRIQAAVANYLKAKYPTVLFTIAPSGTKIAPWMAKMFKAMGYRAGTPDLMIFEPRMIYHGMFLELKTEEGQVKESQKEFLAELDKRGYKTYVCYGYDAAVEAIERYFGEK